MKPLQAYYAAVFFLLFWLAKTRCLASANDKFDTENETKWKLAAKRALMRCLGGEGESVGESNGNEWVPNSAEMRENEEKFVENMKKLFGKKKFNYVNFWATI